MTGYKYGGGTFGSDKIHTCKEEDLVNRWWDFQTKNTIVNTLVPGYEDLCVYLEYDKVFFWNYSLDGGTYQNNWDWYCVNHNTMKVVDTNTGESYSVIILGKDSYGCYDIEVSDSGITVRGDICPCDDPFEE